VGPRAASLNAYIKALDPVNTTVASSNSALSTMSTISGFKAYKTTDVNK
jgi:hypothetical protein